MIAKRGLSDVITTVLIVLLAIGAIAIVGGLVFSLIQDAGDAMQTQCLQLDIEPVNCVVHGDDGSNYSDVTYRWNSGDVELTGVRVLVTDESNSNAVDTGDAPSSTLATSRVTNLNVTDAGLEFTNVNELRASVAGVIIDSRGNEHTCPEARRTIVCSEAAAE